jgi:CheY-like chemotaxis protein
MPKPMFYIYQGFAAEELGTDEEGIPVHKQPVVVKVKDDCPIGLKLKAIAVSEKGLKQYFWDNYCGEYASIHIRSDSDIPEELIKGENGLEIILRTRDRFKRDYLYPDAVHPQKEDREYVVAEGATPPIGVRFKYTREDLETSEKQKVLIVEDEDMIRTLLQRMLTISYPGAYEFKTANNGEQGAQLIEEYNPDLVFTDLLMPGQNGVYVTRKAKEKNPDTKVVLMTGTKFRPEAQEAVEAGACYVLQKPFGIADVKKAMEAAFNPDQNLEGNLD